MYFSLFDSCVEIEEDNTCGPQLQYSFAAPAVFEGTNTLFNEIELVLRQLGSLDACRAFITTVICVFRFPACNPVTGRLLPICQSSCGSVDSIISQCSAAFFRNDPMFPAVNGLLDAFVCLEPLTYYNFPLEYIETENISDCSEVGK